MSTKEASEMFGEDFIDVRDLIARCEELREERDAQEIPANEYGGPLDTWKDEREELAQLESLLADLRGAGGDEQWEGNWYPVTLIREDKMEDYARETAEDCGMIPKDLGWPCTCIDWDKATEEFKMDYTMTEIGGTTYYFR